MVDKISESRRRANMRAIRSKNMKPELVVRSTAHKMGYRFRLHRKDLPGKPDLVFSSRRKVIFVHGCFWHQHELPDCRDGRMPKSNLKYWKPKLARNVARDRENISILQDERWKSLIIWECETNDIEQLQILLSKFLTLVP